MAHTWHHTKLMEVCNKMKKLVQNFNGKVSETGRCLDLLAPALPSHSVTRQPNRYSQRVSISWLLYISPQVEVIPPASLFLSPLFENISDKARKPATIWQQLLVNTIQEISKSQTSYSSRRRNQCVEPVSEVLLAQPSWVNNKHRLQRKRAAFWGIPAPPRQGLRDRNDSTPKTKRRQGKKLWLQSLNRVRLSSRTIQLWC